MTTPVNNGSTYLPSAGEGTVPLWPGIYAGTVINNDDPLGVGRLQLNVPQVLGNSVSAWAVPLGTYYSIPNNTTTVACSFIGGDPSQPAWIGPLDLDPIINAGITAVYYTPSAPADPKIGDVWYETFAVDGTTFYGPAQIWTFNSGTSTFSWVTSAQSGAGTNPLGVVEPDITGGTITGATFIADGTSGQILAYTGTPASGNLDASVSPVPGNDYEIINVPEADGNQYISGVATYGTGSSNAYSALTVFGDTLNGSSAAHVQATGTTVELTPAKFQTWAQGSGSTEQIVSWLTGPVSTADSKGVGIALLSSETGLAAGHLCEGYLMSISAAGALEILVWNSSEITANAPIALSGGVTSPHSALSGYTLITQADNTVDNNANLTGYNPMTRQWSIPANDAQVGTIYEIETPFSFTTWTTVETYGYKPSLNGTAVSTSGGDIIGATAMAPSTTYTGEIRLRMVVISTGTSGVVNIFIKGGVAFTGNLQGGASTDAWFLSSQATNVAFNTTVSNTIALDSSWGGNPSGTTQTASNYGSVFTRKGA